ncbi:response regulator transcription factor [Georgenia sp. Z1491]|uniref:response regulator transcription factor n=1 Tax=Georgenia sp. Z1491 TaxID=3416707 RepID=UPI003CF34ECA
MRTAVVVEDDADIRFLLETTLRQAGFEVHAAATGVEGVEAVRRHDPLVTTLDISLPDIDGFEVARQIRTFSSTYVLMLTGRSDEIDTLLGLEAGADDYVTKPFRPREVRARIEAMLRRPRAVAGPVGSSSAASAGSAPVAVSGEPAAPLPPPTTTNGSAEGAPRESSAPAAGSSAEGPASPAPTSPPGGGLPDADDDSVLRHGGLLVDVGARLTSVDDVAVHLTRSEFDILVALVGAGRRVVEKDSLVRAAWGDADDHARYVTDPDRRAVEVHIANLRRKLGDGASAPRFIETVRGVGYRMAAVR